MLLPAAALAAAVAAPTLQAQSAGVERVAQPMAAAALPEAPEPQGQQSKELQAASTAARRAPLCGVKERAGSRRASQAAQASADAQQHGQPGCRTENPLQEIVSSPEVSPLTPDEKAILAARGVLDPFNLLTLVASSAIATAANSHSAYGPGVAGFGRQVGYGLAEDTEGQALAVYLIPTLTHEDPRYHRAPGRPIVVRALHAVAHTFVSQHDDGRLMPNYAVLGTYPIAQSSFNLYVPGLNTSAEATTRRIVYGIATNPVGDLIAEFLPDVARRVHVRVVFVQQIMNKVAQGSPGTM